jgi:hypothetical protein
MIIADVMQRLALSRPVFHSEADFQHALALAIREGDPKTNMRLEYPARLLTRGASGRNMVDIWLEDSHSAIELKYKPSEFRGSVKDEDYDLRPGKTHNSRYDFVKDLKKLEELTDSNGVKSCYAILLTNDERLWNKSRKPSSVSSDFALVGTVGGKMKYHSGEREDITLRGEYELVWTPYSTVCGTLFKYLCVRVK